MNKTTLARRTALRVHIAGVDVSEDINRYLLSASFSDNESDKTDDLQLELDDREGWWAQWLRDTHALPPPPLPVSSGELRIGDIVEFRGGTHFRSSMASESRGGNRRGGPARITRLAPNARQPVHVIGGWGRNQRGTPGDSNVYGWVTREQIGDLQSNADGDSASSTAVAGSRRAARGDLKGARISADIIQQDIKDRLLNCGSFEIDSISANGPPARVTIRATSLSHKANIRCEEKTWAWENVRLSMISRQIAGSAGMTFMFLSEFDPHYLRIEQNNESDIALIRRLCYDAGLVLKITDNTLVLFDEREFEKKAAVATIRCGESDVLSYRFTTNLNDTVYGRCHVIFTNSRGETIEYLYTPRDGDPDAPTLVIREKVTDRNAARNLAMRRLRQKNKQEYSAAFTIVGDVKYAAGCTVNITGYGVFDGKHIIERNVSNVTASGFTMQLTLRRVLEEEQNEH
jgi:phage protein D